MSNYVLYGTELIQNDKTLKDFATCLYNNCPMEAIIEDGEERKEFILESVANALTDDINRTDINYEELLYKYRSEIGYLLYEIENNGFPMTDMAFFGEQAELCFNELVFRYIDIHYDEFANGTIA